MTYLFDVLPFGGQSRLTGVWQWPWRGDEQALDLRVLVSLVKLGKGQDGWLESDFLSSHLPWALGGLQGTDASGEEWLVVVQVAPASASELAGAGSPWWAMRVGLDRAMEYNPDAELLVELTLERADILVAYQDAGVEPVEVHDWAVTDLMVGLLAACTYVPLREIVTGRLTGCSLPAIEHDCQHDAFTDAFAAWAVGLLRGLVPAWDDDEVAFDEDDPGGGPRA